LWALFLDTLFSLEVHAQRISQYLKSILEAVMYFALVWANNA